MKKLLFPAIIALGLSACADEGPAERAGEAFDDAADSVGDAARDVRDEAEDLANELEQ